MPEISGTGLFAQGRGRKRGGAGGGRGAGRGNRLRGRGPGANPTGQCTCLSCGYSNPHQAGMPCSQSTCPKCGARMYRQFFAN